ncbi:MULTISPECIES: ribonuclease E activity regulator RraA [Pseudomonas syringae group]|uniref:4-hydroxy-4-methyl-2-oxoglutarate aldolase n=1 Tax=Pseudomonas syringae pv. ribicola TaxID=55398 RepID=A0A0P9YJ11_PSESI|nr:MULTISPECIES: ribonuclease E activity regulator RraA [Pseudomonas syringae group]EKN44637.1 ribonuclease activity regulator protein RraA [Pseudomonas viridiflava UASWS0038]KPL62645.1 ribonuclease activity regulator protein RraA [Pseudomonas viridiflava]KPY44461.1 Ribonuclease activity regulator protein RraA [Pseudomonas syringae pv. ribicola]KPZ15830.1 Ribonuclease activity regulator protein RraA [Pseudomonas viridiflava]OAG92684.1 ribonuclease activity regulator protein RraA [Pseudomonas v
MHYLTPDLCDAYPDLIQVVEPMFSNFGGRDSFGGQIITLKCFEDNSLVKEQIALDGKGKVLVVDGGGSLRCAMLGDMVAEQASKNGWEGLLIYGCVRDVDMLAQTDLGVQALASHPKKSEKRGIGELNVPVTFGGVTFKPGDYLYADNNGVIISPSPLTMPE